MMRSAVMIITLRTERCSWDLSNIVVWFTEIPLENQSDLMNSCSEAKVEERYQLVR